MEENIIDNIAEFHNILWTTGDFYNKTFNLENCVLEFYGDYKVGGGTDGYDNSNYTFLTISNCTFNCEKIEFNDIIQKNLHIYFEDCTFNCGISFKNSSFKELWFSNIKSLLSLNFEMDKSKEDKVISNLIRFVNDKNSSKIKSQFIFNNVEIKNALIIENIDIEEIIVSNSFINDFSIYNSSLSDLYFDENSFSGNTRFNKIILQNNDSSIDDKYRGFSKNKFENTTFLETEFIEKKTFENCEFKNITRFEKCKNLENSELKFVDCEFKGFTSFKHSEFNSLDIDNCIFENSTSFIEAIFNKIRLSEANFLGKTYFDDIKINDVANESYLEDNVTEWKRTLRTIKQELQKTENKIDYGRFRVYEFNAYRRELTNRKPKDKILSRANRENNRLSRDLFILRLSNAVSEYGTNWKRAFLFTLSFGFIAYFAITFIESRLIGSQLSFDSSDINSFINGMFKFFIVTDFKSILDLKVAFEDKYCLYSIMVFLYRITFVGCKIIIAFGIYETVQSFRKFKV
ncbi:pentapeptide repeat-containing protein [Flavobacterium laiguense]|uniref:Pentapeptide repeat-containing protein n=1 Tax=Flavobacterium laiguense TaxID=2169409 RepID=A0A2U1JVZ7_9FLAO|nr:pentapeptide repeat-containing protein [Flavobacterium laiguense]PWA09376.1 hypothetical protein DB891_08815 [Flavobacterium laiguense]